MTTRAEISKWFDRGVDEGATHMIVVCDTYDWEDYPVYVKHGSDPKFMLNHYNGKNMQKVMEVYNLSMDKTDQLNEIRAMNF
jgi:hypothetical protein